MRIQLSLLNKDRRGRLRIWSELPQPTRQQVLEGLADLLLRSVRRSPEKEQPANEEQVDDTR